MNHEQEKGLQSFLSIESNTNHRKSTNTNHLDRYRTQSTPPPPDTITSHAPLHPNTPLSPLPNPL